MAQHDVPGDHCAGLLCKPSGRRAPSMIAPRNELPMNPAAALPRGGYSQGPDTAPVGKEDKEIWRCRARFILAGRDESPMKPCKNCEDSL